MRELLCYLEIIFLWIMRSVGRGIFKKNPNLPVRLGEPFCGLGLMIKSTDFFFFLTLGNTS